MNPTLLIFFFFDAGATQLTEARVTQTSLEVVQPATVAARVTQESAEVVFLPTAPTGFTDCGTFLGARECEVRAYDSNLARTFLALPDWMESIEWEILERGGCGTASINALAAWEDLTFAGNERFDVYLFGEPAYRGWLRLAEKQIANPERAAPRLYGLMEIMDKWLVTRKFAYGCDTDISDVFRDLLSHLLTSARQAQITVTGANAVVSAETIGVTVKEFDARGKGGAAAINQLLDIAPNTATWGCGFATSADWRGLRENRIYLQKRNTATATVYSIGDNVVGFTYPPDTSRVVNSLHLTGGTVLQPNLLTNGSFEDLKPAGDDVANLLLNPSFETGGSNAAPTNWTSSGGTPAGKWPGEGGAFGSARTDARWLELDQANEGVYQDAAIVHGGNYTAACWARLEDATIGNSFTLWLQGLDASDNIISSVFQSFSLDAYPTDPLAGIYQRFEVSQDWALFPSVTQARVKIEANGGSESNDGVLIDDASLYVTCGVGQSNWQFIPTGNAVIEELEWDYGTSPFHGGLALHVSMSGISVSADTGELYTFQSKSPSVKANERYTLIVRWHVAGVGGASDSAFSMGAVSVKSDNTQSTLWDSSDTFGSFIGNPSTWKMQSFPIITESDTVRLQVFVRVRTERDFYLDGLMLVEGEVPADVSTYDGWWDGETYEADIDVTATDLTGLTAAADASITTYGERGEAVSQELVKDRASLVTYATAYFNAHAVPEVSGSVSVEGPREQLSQSGTVKLINLPSAPDPLFPSRIRYTVDETIRLEADLGNDVADLTDLLRFSAERARQGL